MKTDFLNRMNLHGKTVLITGGSRGIGKGIFEAFAAVGADIGIMGRNRADGEAAVQELAGYGGRYRYYQGDTSQKADCKRVVQSFVEDFGSVDILVNNAACVRIIRTLDMDDNLQEWDDVISTNLNGTFYMCYYAAGAMREQLGGNIINISSMSAELVNYPMWQASYNASKAGVNHLTRSLQAEWADHGIRVNAVAPGYVKTEMTLDDTKPPFLGVTAQWIKNTPRGCFGTPKDIAGAVLFLASDLSVNCMGTILLCDGGFSLGK